MLSNKSHTYNKLLECSPKMTVSLIIIRIVVEPSSECRLVGRNPRNTRVAVPFTAVYLLSLYFLRCAIKATSWHWPISRRLIAITGIGCIITWYYVDFYNSLCRLSLGCQPTVDSRSHFSSALLLTSPGIPHS